MVLYKNISDFETVSFNAFERFQHISTDIYCSYTKLKIENAVSSISGSIIKGSSLKKVLRIKDNGMVTILFDELVEGWDVYFSVFNGYIWSTEMSPLIRITIYNDYVYIPDPSPVFDSDPKPLILDLVSWTGGSIAKFKLPKMINEETQARPTSFKVKVSGDFRWLEVDTGSEPMNLEIDTEKIQSGAEKGLNLTFFLNIKLTDALEISEPEEYTISLTVIRSYPPQKDITKKAEDQSKFEVHNFGDTETRVKLLTVNALGKTSLEFSQSIAPPFSG